ncbi:helix-turn-helix transcriptional regulator [bacterium]|nr:helix-turn-helix transcriptional regulator [bacterium]
MLARRESTATTRATGKGERGRTPSKGERELEDLQAVFAALAHETRRHILIVLRFRGGRMTAGEIAARFHCSWPTTTRHLRVLEDAGLVTVEASGRQRNYVLQAARLTKVGGDWLRWFETSPEGE